MTMKLAPHHVAISVSVLERSLNFYGQLGFQQVHCYEDKSKTIVQMKLDSFCLEIFCFKLNGNAAALDYDYIPDLSKIGLKHFALKTDNVHRTLKELQSKGLADKNVQIDESLERLQYFFIQDPDGIWLEIIKDDRY